MYLRPVHTDLDPPTLYNFIHSNPLGVLTTAIPSPSFPTIQSSHIPWVLDIPSSDTSPPKLRGHIALANPQAKALLAAAASSPTSGSEDADSETNGMQLEEEVMILFTSPITHYITPKFYVETKPTTGKVVPTWNYAAVQVYGRLRIHCGSSGPAFLARQIRDLSSLCEEGQMGYAADEAWTVDEAPEKYVGLLSRAIVGVEIEVVRMAGKWKMSQESVEGDREGVVSGFEALGTERGREVAGMVRERARVMEARKGA